jgi:hypothetical protein
MGDASSPLEFLVGEGPLGTGVTPRWRAKRVAGREASWRDIIFRLPIERRNYSSIRSFQHRIQYPLAHRWTVL